MGCKFSNKESSEDQTEIVAKLTKKELNSKYEEDAPIRNEADVQIRISDLIGERKGNISDHYDFVKVLGEGTSLFSSINVYADWAKAHSGRSSSPSTRSRASSGQ